MEELLKKMTYGHYILTALRQGGEIKEPYEDFIAAGTVHWATQVSFEPLEIGVAIGRETNLNKAIENGGYFTLHLLSRDHKELIEKFAGANEVEGNKINGVEFRKEDGEIVLPDTLGYIKCKVVNTMRTGDHHFYVGEPVDIKELKDKHAICTMDVPAHYTPAEAET